VESAIAARSGDPGGRPALSEAPAGTDANPAARAQTTAIEAKRRWRMRGSKATAPGSVHAAWTRRKPLVLFVRRELPEPSIEGRRCMRSRLIVLVFVLGLVAVGAAVAGLNRNWSAHANGALEVPARDTSGQGQAIFQLSKDGAALDYKLMASNIENVFQAHIHLGVPGMNGPIVVWLFPSTAPVPGPLGAGRTDGVLAEGTITAANFVNDLAGQPMSALITALDSGRAYVNIHTNDGVGAVNTGPGDFPGGEIRGDVD
jgi:CHRD domain